MEGKTMSQNVLEKTMKKKLILAGTGLFILGAWVFHYELLMIYFIIFGWE